MINILKASLVNFSFLGYGSGGRVVEDEILKMRSVIRVGEGKMLSISLFAKISFGQKSTNLAKLNCRVKDLKIIFY